VSIRLAAGLSLPLEACTQTFGILAIRGVGKTHTMRRMAEEFGRHQLPFVFIDPVGVAWGLRSSADGKKPGLPIIILGGEHGDVPLEATGGSLVAELVAEEHVSLVLDLSGLRTKGDQRRFITDFAETLYRRNREPLHLFLDEADEVAPQRPPKGFERMLGAVEQLVRRGRARGIGVTMATQRSAVLNKDVLTQIETLVCLRTVSPQDRKAVDEWIRAHASEEERQEFTRSIASLAIGEAYFWSPGWLKTFKRVKIEPCWTFDSSATPKVGRSRVGPQVQAEIDLGKLETRMRATIEKAKAEDPKELRRQIAELKRQVAELEKRPAKTEIKELPVITAAQLSDLRGLLEPVVQALSSGALPAPANGKPKEVVPCRKEKPNRVGSHVDKPGDVGKAASPGVVSGSQQRILDALHWIESIGVSPASKAQIALLSNQSPTSGGYFNNLGKLRSLGLLEYPSPGQLAITADGRAQVRASGRPRSTPTSDSELHEQVLSMVSGSQATILRALIEAHPNYLPKSVLAEKVGQSPTSGGYFNNLGRLRTLGLIDYPQPGAAVAAEILFLG